MARRCRDREVRLCSSFVTQKNPFESSEESSWKDLAKKRTGFMGLTIDGRPSHHQAARLNVCSTYMVFEHAHIGSPKRRIVHVLGQSAAPRRATPDGDSRRRATPRIHRLLVPEVREGPQDEHSRMFQASHPQH